MIHELLKYLPKKKIHEILDIRKSFYNAIEREIGRLPDNYDIDINEAKLLIDISFFVKEVIIPISHVNDFYNKISPHANVIQSGKLIIDKKAHSELLNLVREIDKIIYVFNVSRNREIGQQFLAFEKIEDFLKAWRKNEKVDRETYSE